jgi:hypothetical protein
MLNYSIELEEKIQGNNLNGEHTYTMIFCGDNTTWHKDELEDFSHLYFNDAFRPDDSFGKMQKHNIESKNITLKRNISSFCYFERKTFNAQPSSFECNIRGLKIN